MATIYKILSPCLQECYVGSTTTEVERRWWHHRSDQRNTTTSKKLFDKYGTENCKFVVMEVCSLEERRIKEQWWLDHSVGAVNERKANLTSEDFKEYCEANRDKKNARMKEYYEANSDRIKARMKERYVARKALNQMGK